MRPTREQIELAAYHRWQRRGWRHGGDLDDWGAAEKDLSFALNYRYIARHKLSGEEPVAIGKGWGEASGRRRRCRYCERAEPTARFQDALLALPALAGNTSLFAWDECGDCRAEYEAHLAGPFEAFLRPLLGDPPALPEGGVPVPALKALVRMALGVIPEAELHHFGDTIEWVANPDHGLDAALLRGLGCHVYTTPVPVPSPSVAVARRVQDDEATPYMVAFLALAPSRVVLQTYLPFCPRDEDLEQAEAQAPLLSMSLSADMDHRASDCTFLGVTPPETVRVPTRGTRPGQAERPSTTATNDGPRRV